MTAAPPTALDAFLARKAEIDSLLARLAGLSADHSGVAPDEVDWGQVGTLGAWLDHLRQVADSAFREGEYAG